MEELIGVLLTKGYGFYLGNKLVGTLSWETGTFKFEGDVEKSAQAFFDWLAYHDIVAKKREEK